MDEAQSALRLSPRDLEIHHTVGAVYERMHKYEEAAGAFSNYVNLLPNKDHSEKADWSRSEIKFLRSFGQRVPFEMDAEPGDQLYTIDFRLINEKVVVRAKVNDGSFQDFVVDTGAENTVISRPTAQRLGITPITYTLSAGVGDVGLRGLQLARINTLELGLLKLRNVPCLIKDPPLRDLPVKEAESLSPLALGFSIIIDYKAKKITFGKHLPTEAADFELPLRLHRLVKQIDEHGSADAAVEAQTLAGLNQSMTDHTKLGNDKSENTQLLGWEKLLREKAMRLRELALSDAPGARPSLTLAGRRFPILRR